MLLVMQSLVLSQISLTIWSTQNWRYLFDVFTVYVQTRDCLLARHIVKSTHTYFQLGLPRLSIRTLITVSHTHPFLFTLKEE